LSALTLSPGTLEPTFVANTTDYTANVASDVTSVTISASKADPNAVLSGCVTVGSGTATGQASIPLNGPGTATPASFTVPAPNGSPKTYCITVKRATPSGNNNLSMLSLSAGTMSPPFSANIPNYTVNVGSNVTNVTVSATKADLNALISGDVSAGAGVATGQATIQLSGPGTTTVVTIWVTAPGGSQKTYTLNVSRTALGGNNNLQRLSVSPGTLAPLFSASEIFYTVKVGCNVTNVNVTPTLQDVNSSITINGQGTSSGQTRSIALAPAGSSTEIEIIVTAPNGSYKTYLITVSRAAFPRAVEVEPELERREAESSATTAGAVNSDSPRESFSTQGVEEFSGVKQEPARSGEERMRRLNGQAQLDHPSLYFLVAGGLLAVIGAFAASEIVTFYTHKPVPAPFRTIPLAKADESGEQIIGRDGAPMVRVPAGEFMMGSLEGHDEEPVHPVHLEAFYIDQYEVTISHYATFVLETERDAPWFWSEQVLEQHGRKPVVGVDWNDATAYCSWAGKRLPTEAEWEKAARGTDQRRYPWGNADPDPTLANYSRGSDFFEDFRVLTDVGSFHEGKGPYGTYDMAGNVWEWVADRYSENYYSVRTVRNPKGPSDWDYRVIRGGCWDRGWNSLRSAFRTAYLTNRDAYVGFRCAQDVPN